MTATTKAVSSIIGGVIGVFILVTIYAGIYTIEEGYQGVVKTFGEAKKQVGPGLHFKIPYVESVEEIETRTKKNVETMPVATKEQMRAQATVSVNWTVKKEAVLDLFKKYGSLAQFEARMLDPKLRDIAKRSISSFTAEDNINKRETVKSMMESELAEATVALPITIDTVQYENINLPDNYLKSIDAKQTAKNERDAEQFRLDKQKLEAMRAVNTADAEKQSAQLKADGVAYQIRTEAKAEAEKITMLGKAEASAINEKSKALKGNPLLVDLTRAQNWNGQYPGTFMSNDPSLLMQMK